MKAIELDRSPVHNPVEQVLSPNVEKKLEGWRVEDFGGGAGVEGVYKEQAKGCIGWMRLALSRAYEN